VVSVGLVESWDDELGDLLARIAGRFARVERMRAFAYVRGLLAPLGRHNGWTLAERAGDGSPDGMQALLCSPRWDRDAVRDDVRGYVVERIGDPDGVQVARPRVRAGRHGLHQRPTGTLEQALHPVRGVVAGRLCDCPAVLAGQPRQQAKQDIPEPVAWVPPARTGARYAPSHHPVPQPTR
jgi:hypothetical protein